ncbi:hypothetical protein FSARC_8372 [Fusarium sarcochroum]|uniref:Uncharacterized protein n=1 Tax=Fusarium sarcochroum TaxID=1208366 RepID=A0A8H4TT82_9HYPO|nr:hypothetical protein FSARC_8372 [Fusarium sarcochroum]
MVSLKAIAAAIAAANLLGADAGPCRPGTKTSLSLSGSETLSSSPTISTSISGSSAMSTDPTSSPDTTLSTDGTTDSNPTTSGNPTSSSSETLSYPTSSSNPTTSGNPTSSTIATFSSPTISVDSTTSNDATTSVDSTMSVDPTTSGNPTTSADTTASEDSTTTSADPTTTTTSVCVEPTNMLRRPGFEPSNDGDVWGFYWGGGEISEDTANARTGDWLAVLPVPNGQERRMEQRITVVSETEYTISFYYAVANPPSVDTQCFLFATFDYYTLLKRVPLPSDSEYHLYSERFISADNLDPVVEIGISCPQANNGYTATIYIDDTEVRDPAKDCDATPVDPSAPSEATLLIPAEPESPRCPVNVARIPGFEPENGNQAWAFYNNGEFVQDESNARTGEWSALLPGQPSNNAIYLEQNFNAEDVIAGEDYDFHFFWKAKTLPDNGQCYITGGYNDNTVYQAAEVNLDATSSTGYSIFSVRFQMPAGPLLLQIILYCDYSTGNQEPGAVYVDDTALIRVGGCEAYPKTGALIENPSFEIRATEDSAYAWFGTNGMTIKAGTEDANGPSPNSGNNFLYTQLEFTKRSGTMTKQLASSLNAGQAYDLQFNWSAGSAYSAGDCAFTIAFGSNSQTSDLNDDISPYEYQLFQHSFTPAEDATSMSVTVSCKETSEFPDFAFDDFVLN